MWLRSEIKERGKQNFKKTYLYAIVVSLVIQSMLSFSFNLDLREKTSFEAKDMINIILPKFVNHLTAFLSDNLMASYTLVLFILSILIKLFVCYSIEIGGRKFYLFKPEEERTFHCLLYSFKSGYYTTHISIMFKRTLFTILWSFLFGIPGIVKSYEYRMIPYLLAENENLTCEQAFSKSREMMNGQKWNVFVLDLSFLLWNILSLCTLNLVGIFYVRPYYDATNAELYLELSR